MKENNNENLWKSYKVDILTLQRANALTDIKFADDYFDIMHNEWLLEQYISRFGIVSEEAPCLTAPAIEAAVKAGYAINLVVQILKDDTIVCFKHKSLGESTGLNAYVTNVSYDEIKELTIRNTKEHILTLAEALDIVDNKVPVVIEIMNESFVGKMESKIEQILDAYCKKHDCPGRVAIMSVNPFVLEWFYDNAPWYTRMIKSGCFKDIKTYANIKTSKLKKLKYLKLSKADFIVYIAKDLPTKYIRKNKVVGVIAYNVMSQEEYKRVLPYADNIVFTSFTPEI